MGLNQFHFFHQFDFALGLAGFGGFGPEPLDESLRFLDLLLLVASLVLKRLYLFTARLQIEIIVAAVGPHPFRFK